MKRWFGMVTGGVATAVLIPALAFGQAPAGDAASGTAESEKDVRPLIVKVHADWCAKCKAIAPTWTRIEKELAGEARVVVLDVTDEKRAVEAKRLAEELGIAGFFSEFRAKTGTVAIFEPGAAEPSKVLVAEKDFAPYREALVEITAG